MKALHATVSIQRLSLKVDKSASCGVTFGELTDDEVNALRDYAGKNAELLLKPLDETPEDLLNVGGQAKSKTQSQKVRDALYILWKELTIGTTSPVPFDDFYIAETNVFLKNIEQRIDDAKL
jgi:hypothetical protein